MLNELVKYHKDWLNIAYTYLNNRQDAEDIVQDMYIRIHDYGIELDRVRYKNGVNKYFFYQVIRNMCLLFVRNRYNTVSIDTIPLTPETKDSSEEALQRIFNKIDAYIQTWNAYERDIFEIYMYTGLSLRDISYGTIKNQGERKEIKKAKFIDNVRYLHDRAVNEGTAISVMSLFTTIKKCKEILKEKFSEDFEDYFNNDFDFID